MADDSKTEKATPKKRRDERKEGHVFSSKDVIVVVSLLGTFYGLQILFPTIYKTIRENLPSVFTSLSFLNFCFIKT